MDLFSSCVLERKGVNFKQQQFLNTTTWQILEVSECFVLQHFLQTLGYYNLILVEMVITIYNLFHTILHG